MNTKRLLPALIAALGFGVAQAAPIVVSYYFDAMENTPPTAGIGALTTDLTGTGLTASSSVDISNIGFSAWQSSDAGNAELFGGGFSVVYRGGTNVGNDSDYATRNPGPGASDWNEHISFTVVNNSGSAWEITDFNFQIGWNLSANQSFKYYADILVGSDIEWNSDVSLIGTRNGADGDVDGQTYPWRGASNSMSVSLADGESATFRLYSNQNGGNRRLYINQFEAVMVPEPGTLVLVGIALGSVFFFRRRR
jgi:hypothetical protein